MSAAAFSHRHMAAEFRAWGGRNVMKYFAAAVLATFGAVLASLPAARADASCPPNPTGTVNGNLVVPPGQTCTLTNVTVTGNVQVGAGATLFAAGGA
jgi:hypothetical protein